MSAFLLIGALSILGASYGQADVTGQVQGMVQGDYLQVPASNDVFGDSFPGIRKTLVVVYQYPGQAPRTMIAVEGSVLSIQPAPVYVYAPAPVYDPPPAEYVPPPPPVVYVMPPPPAQPVGYLGHHPVPGGGWCLAEGPHLHPYEPEFFDQYQMIDGYFRFGYGWHEWSYWGPHPIAGGGWCGIGGFHKHPYAAEVGYIYDPGRRGYYYDREHSQVITVEVVHPGPGYHQDPHVIEHANHPPPPRVAPAGTPAPRVWEREKVVQPPPPQHPATQPAVAHPAPEHQMGERPMEHPAEHSAAAPPASRPPEPEHGTSREPPPAVHPALAPPPAHEPPPANRPPEPEHGTSREPPPAAHAASPAAHAAPPPAPAHPAAAAPVKTPPPAAKPAAAPPPAKKKGAKDEKK